MRSEKVMVRLAPWKRSMECMREGRWNRVLDLECKSDQSEFHLKFVQFEFIFGQWQFSLRFDQLEWYFNDLNAYFVNFIKPWDWRCAGGGGLVHGGDVEDARDCGVVVDDLPVAHVPVREAAVEVEQQIVAGPRFNLDKTFPLFLLLLTWLFLVLLWLGHNIYGHIYVISSPKPLHYSLSVWACDWFVLGASD